MIDVLGAAWGRLVASYSRILVTSGRTSILCRQPLPQRPCFFICWHSASLVAMAVHASERRRPVAALTWTPRGLAGSAMRSWLEGLNILPIPINETRNIGQVLKTVRRLVEEGHDMLIAVDGPDGPRRQVKPIGPWLAARSGADVRGFGCAAAPCLTSPRWDRLVIPLPASHVGAVVSPTLRFETGARRDRSGASVARILDELDAEAARLIWQRREKQLGGYATWK